MSFTEVDNASRWAGFVLDVAPDGSVPWWQAIMRSTTTAANGIELAQRTPSDSWNVPYATSAPTDAGTGRDVRIAVEVQGRSATWIFDGEEVLSGQIGRSDDGVFGFVTAAATIERGEQVVIAVASTDADAVTVAVDGKSVDPAGTIPATDLGVGTHVVTAEATGPGGTATDEATITVTVTVAGLRARIAALDVSPGRMQQLLRALADGDWDRLRDRIDRFVDDEAAADLSIDLDVLEG